MGQPSFQLPNEETLQGLLDDLTRALSDAPDNQERLLSLSAVAWSEDGMVKAEVGPRGQLVALEIDPRVFRRPDAQTLTESIMDAVTEAIRQVTDQTRQVVLGQVPPELAELRAQFQPDARDPMAQILRTDAEILADRRRRTGDNLR